MVYTVEIEDISKRLNSLEARVELIESKLKVTKPSSFEETAEETPPTYRGDEYE